jgi:hypothetical protein
MGEQRDAFRADVVERTKNELAYIDSKAGFSIIAGQLLEEAEELVDYVPSPFRGTGTRRRSLGVDGYAFDDIDGSLRIVITEFGGASLPETITQTSVKAIFGKVTAFIEEALTGSDDHLPADDDPVTDFSGMLLTHSSSITRYRIYLATDGLMSDRIRDWPNQIIQGVPAEFHIWDIDRFFTAFASQSGRDFLTVDFTSFVDGGLPCLPASLNLSEYSGYLCVLPGSALAQIYEKYGSRLLEGNVRSFLGKQRDVNKGMRKTILSSPEMFFAYNNGIAVTARSINFENTSSGMRILSAEDLQIVNGGQTTASLALSRRKDGADLSQIFVQMKLSVVDEDNSGELIENISKYANSQTKVADSDHFSNHEFHRKMEELSRRLRAPARTGSQRPSSWFYERAKGQYRIETSKMSPAEKIRFESDNPRKQLITKTDMSKIENSWRQLPHEVCKGAEKSFGLFSKYVVFEWERQPLQFNDDYFRTVIAHTIVFRELEALIPKEPWYDGAYRSQVVAYTIAKLDRSIAEQAIGQALNTQDIWKNQTMSPALRSQLQIIAAAVYSAITSPDKGFENISEWAKKELAWQRVCQREVRLTPDLKSELISFGENAERKAIATSSAKIDVGFAAVSEVLTYKCSAWKILRQWGLNHQELTPKEDQLLLLASTLGRIPTDRQAAAILLIRNRLMEDGFILS